MKTLRLGAVVLLAVLSALVGCVSGGRGHGPVESFVIPAASNPGLPSDLAGQLNLGPEPKQVFLVVAPGTNVHALVAKLALNTEAVITVISSGTRVVQENGVTPNDFSAPVLYSIEVPGQKEPWRYRVTVRETETNPRLAQLVLPAGARLDPLFNPAVHSYRLEVPFASTKVRIEARAQSQFAKGISVDGAETPGPAAAAVVDFSSGQERPVTIETLAEDGITRGRYVITLVRGAPDANALLGSLDLQGVPFSPVFTPAQLGYQAIVPFETQSLVVHALPQSPVATVALSAAVSISKGKAAVVQLVSSGDAAGASGAVVDFSQGNSLPLIVAVTAQDGSVQQYLIDIRRAPPDANNLLADLSLGTMAGAARLAPDFLPSRLRYTVVVPFSARQVRVMAHPQSRVAALQLGAGLPGAGGRGAVPSTGDPLSRDGALVDLPPAIERFPLLVTVTAQNGAALRYVVELRRAAPDRNSDLASLSVSGGALTPLFTPRVFSYAVALPPNVDTVKVGAAAAGPGATVTVAGRAGHCPVGKHHGLSQRRTGGIGCHRLDRAGGGWIAEAVHGPGHPRDAAGTRTGGCAAGPAAAGTADPAARATGPSTAAEAACRRCSTAAGPAGSAARHGRARSAAARPAGPAATRAGGACPAGSAARTRATSTAAGPGGACPAARPGDGQYSPVRDSSRRHGYGPCRGIRKEPHRGTAGGRGARSRQGNGGPCRKSDRACVPLQPGPVTGLVAR